MGYVLILLILALVLAVVILLWPEQDYYKLRPSQEGLHVLEQVVLQRLRDARVAGERGLHAEEISKRSGIGPRCITDGILERLVKAKRIERVSPRGPWRIRMPARLEAMEDQSERRSLGGGSDLTSNALRSGILMPTPALIRRMGEHLAEKCKTLIHVLSPRRRSIPPDPETD